MVRTDVGIASVVSTKPGQKVVCDAIWDTGANASAISLSMARKLGLQPVESAFFSTANGRCEMPIYMVDMTLPNGWKIPDVMVSGLNLGVCDALVGMDIITRGDFHLTNREETVLEFVIPPGSDNSR